MVGGSHTMVHEANRWGLQTVGSAATCMHGDSRVQPYTRLQNIGTEHSWWAELLAISWGPRALRLKDGRIPPFKIDREVIQHYLGVAWQVCTTHLYLSGRPFIKTLTHHVELWSVKAHSVWYSCVFARQPLFARDSQSCKIHPAACKVREVSPTIDCWQNIAGGERSYSWIHRALIRSTSVRPHEAEILSPITDWIDRKRYICISAMNLPRVLNYIPC